MITSDHITFDGKFAWMVEWPAPDSPSGWPVNRNDRPCDTCSQWNGNGMDDDVCDCADCRGTGRHLFDIEVEDTEAAPIYLGHPMARTYRVSVVEMLPIVEWGDGGTDACVDEFGNVWGPGTDREGEPMQRLVDHATLPSAAAPGMWAVKLAEVQR